MVHGRPIMPRSCHAGWDWPRSCHAGWHSQSPGCTVHIVQTQTRTQRPRLGRPELTLSATWHPTFAPHIHSSTCHSGAPAAHALMHASWQQEQAPPTTEKLPPHLHLQCMSVQCMQYTPAAPTASPQRARAAAAAAEQNRSTSSTAQRVATCMDAQGTQHCKAMHRVRSRHQ